MINNFTKGMAKRWYTVDDIFEWFTHVKTFCRSIRSININDEYVREVIQDARHTRTFVEFCDYVVLHKNVRIV